MLRLELDVAPGYAGRELEYGRQLAGGEPTGVTVERGRRVGPAGWPTVVVLAEGENGAEAGPRLWAWLRDVYGADEEQASELASLADVV